MDEAHARRTIAALVAIVQSMIPIVYSETHGEDGREIFEVQLREDDPLAMAIVNELTEKELDDAFRWVETSRAGYGNELSANPVRAFLSPEQLMRARIALLASDEADNAHTLVVRMPDRPAQPPLSPQDRVRIGEDAFMGRIELDVLHEQDGWSGFTMRAKADLDERIEYLPEPWRTNARRRLPELRARIRETLDGAGESGAESRDGIS